MRVMVQLHPEHVEADIVITLGNSEKYTRSAVDVYKILFAKYGIKSNKKDQQLILKTIVKMSGRGQLEIIKSNNVTYLKLNEEIK